MTGAMICFFLAAVGCGYGFGLLHGGHIATKKRRE